MVRASVTYSPLVAGRAMSEYLWRFVTRADGNDLITLLGDTDVALDGVPFDEASWYDWLSSLDWVVAGHEPHTGSDGVGEWWAHETRRLEGPREVDGVVRRDHEVTVSEGFLAMTEYLWRIANRPGGNNIARAVEAVRIAFASENAAVGSEVWRDWLDSIEWIQSGRPAQTGE